MLSGRDHRYCQAAVWRSAATTGFVRHAPVWAACALEQMLFENHLPFTILLDENLDKWLKGSRVLHLPMSSCISDAQVRRMTQFVQDGGRLLLIGDAGTRDQRTRVREKHAFAPLLPPGALQQIEQIGPPHFVPEVNIGALREITRNNYGRGRISLVPRMPSVRPLDLTRDPYSPVPYGGRPGHRASGQRERDLAGNSSGSWIARRYEWRPRGIRSANTGAAATTCSWHVPTCIRTPTVAR